LVLIAKHHVLLQSYSNTNFYSPGAVSLAINFYLLQHILPELQPWQEGMPLATFRTRMTCLINRVQKKDLLKEGLK
jgi:hypothetical protein